MPPRKEPIPKSEEEPEPLQMTIGPGNEAGGSQPVAGARFGRRGNSPYEIGRLLGRGGMGQVYEAIEPRLERRVALKLLNSDDPDQLARFLREAQAQARIDHEHVCKVYEVGELADGKPYIAMQYIDGEPLSIVEEGVTRPSAALSEMNLEQKVDLMQKVALGIHAAHRKGLIHRDVKPANIMVERAEDGSFRPSVLDFGLARPVAAQAVTSLGLAVGTPNFMAPEQARGDSASLDRRTDVYGLGATLYALLAGKPPFEARSSLDVMVMVTEQEVPTLEGVPRDLSTIVAKCLEKEPARRYDSARALAEDLGRYLDGEPIAARRSSLGYRLWKKAKKHKALAAVSAAAVVLLTVLGGFSARAQWQARERARLTVLFSQEATAIESEMRIAHLSPEHDITPEKNAMRRRMAAVESRIEEIGSVAEGPGHYALGRGYLSLNEHETARRHLEHAWQGGYREGEVAYALGRVMGALYQEELQAVEQIRDPKDRDERRQQAEREYRDPALAYLAEGRGVEVEAPAYVEALVAFYEKRYDDALEKARLASARSPWLYEARELEARIHQAIGDDQRDRGELEAAAEAFARAEAAYGRALEIGRSYSAAPVGLCQLEHSMMQMELYLGGGEVESYFRRGVEACNRAIRLDPEGVDAYRSKMNLLWRMGEGEYRRGEDPRPKLDQAIEAGHIVLRLVPGDSAIHGHLGNVHLIRGWYELNHGIDATASLQQAVESAERRVLLAPNDALAVNSLGAAYRSLAWSVMIVGGDPVPIFDRAEEAFEQAIDIRPDFGMALSNLTATRLNRATYQLDHGEDPTESLAAVAEAGARTLAANPRHLFVRATLAGGHLVQARHLLAEGRDATESLAKAAEGYEEVLSVNPNRMSALAASAEVRSVWGRFELENGRDPGANLQAGREAVQKVLAIDPGNGKALRIGAELDLLGVRWQMARGLSPAAAFERANRTAEEAVEINPEESRVTLAEILWRRARWNRPRPQSAARDIARGLEVLEEALAIKPDLAQAHALCGALYLEQARIEPLERSRLLSRAEDALERALAINRFLAREYGPLLEEARSGRGLS